MLRRVLIASTSCTMSPTNVVYASARAQIGQSVTSRDYIDVFEFLSLPPTNWHHANISDIRPVTASTKSASRHGHRHNSPLLEDPGCVNHIAAPSIPFLAVVLCTNMFFRVRNYRESCRYWIVSNQLLVKRLRSWPLISYAFRSRLRTRPFFDSLLHPCCS